MASLPTILEYATTDELWNEIARRSACALLVRVPKVRKEPIQTTLGSILVDRTDDALRAFELAKWVYENPGVLHKRA